MSELVREIVEVNAGVDGDEENPVLVVEVEGLAPTGGWSNVRLEPHTYIDAPDDGFRVLVDIAHAAFVYNGVGEADFEIVREAPDAVHFLYVGMLRDLKGPDIFIDAFAKAAGKAGANLTTDSFIKAMDSMTIPPDIFGSPEFKFGATKRLGSDASRLSQISDGKWKVMSEYAQP